MIRWGLAIGVLVWSASAAGQIRLKIDRYEASTLPEVRLWVSVLDGNRPFGAGRIKQLSVYADGEQLEDVEFTTAVDRGAPIAVGAVIDARYRDKWQASRDAIQKVFDGLPEESLGMAVVMTSGLEELPKADDALWTEHPAKLPRSMDEIRSGGGDPLLFSALRTALRRFPLAPGLEPERGEESTLPDWPKDKPFPGDRVLYVVADGEMKARADGRPSAQLQELVYLARRRGVRVMAIGLTDDVTQHLWTLRVLSRKTGGTYRRVATTSMAEDMLDEAAREMAGRLVITAEAPDLRRGDTVSFSVRTLFDTGGSRTARDYTDRVGNVLGWWDKGVDFISTRWEKLPFWVRLLITIVAGLLVVGLLALVIILRVRKAARARAAEEKARKEALAKRKPCPVCGNLMMPDWKECLFCAQTRQATAPMRYRLTGRAGTYAGEALRFDKPLVIIGAGAHCDVRLQEHGVAAEHCGVRDRGDDEYLLSDFNSDGGTWVNGEKISQTRLHEGDVIRVGSSEFVFGIES